MKSIPQEKIVRMIGTRPNTLQEWIKYAREFQGLRQSDLSRLSGVSRQGIYDAETLKREISLNTAAKIFSALGLKLTLTVDHQHWVYLTNVYLKKVKPERAHLMHSLRACLFSLFCDDSISLREEKLHMIKVLFRSCLWGKPRMSKKLWRMPYLHHFYLGGIDSLYDRPNKLKFHLDLQDEPRAKRPGPSKT